MEEQKTRGKENWRGSGAESASMKQFLQKIKNGFKNLKENHRNFSF